MYDALVDLNLYFVSSMRNVNLDPSRAEAILAHTKSNRYIDAFCKFHYLPIRNYTNVPRS